MHEEQEQQARLSPLSWGKDTLHALRFLTRLPLPAPVDLEDRAPKRALRAHPVAGAVVGAIGAVILGLCLWAGLPALVSATLAVGALVAVTGAFHEDALADTADGFGGGWTHDEKLEIMRDSRIGSYGVAALCLALMLRVTALSALASSAASDYLPYAALIAAGAFSRGCAVALLSLLPPVRNDGLSSSSGSPKGNVTAQALTAGLILLLLPLWPTAGLFAALTAAAASVIALMLVKRLAENQIGGQTGDVAGACQQTCECVILVAILAMA